MKKCMEFLLKHQEKISFAGYGIFITILIIEVFLFREFLVAFWVFNSLVFYHSSVVNRRIAGSALKGWRRALDTAEEFAKNAETIIQEIRDKNK